MAAGTVMVVVGLGIVLLLIGWALLSLASAVRAVAAGTTDLPA